MSDHRLTMLTALTAAALMVVIGVGAVAGSSSAAGALRPPIDRGLATSGLEDVQVDVRGREVSVRAGTLAELTEAVQVAEQVPGVRRASIDDRPGSVDEIDTTRPYLRLRRDPDRLRILGAVPTAGMAATVKSSAARAFGVPVRGDIAIDPGLPPAAWTGDVPAAFGVMTTIADMELTIDGPTLHLTGSVGSAGERDAVLRVVQEALPSLTVTAVLEITNRSGS